MNPDDLGSLEETFEIVSDDELLRSICRSQQEVDEGKAVRLTRDEVLGRVKRC